MKKEQTDELSKLSNTGDKQASPHDNSSSEEDLDGSKVNPEEDLGRSKFKGHAKHKGERSVSKVSYETGKVFPIRPVPKENKREWKKRNKGKNKKKH